MMRYAPTSLRFVLFLTCLSGSLTAQDTSTIEFARDIRPILADNCFKCHGPDEMQREADLRLDTQQGIFEDANVVTPGDAAASDLYQRVTSEEPDLCMPPPDSGRRLTPEQLSKIRMWIETGALWQTHWSFEPPQRGELPPTIDNTWCRTPIDRFILARLERAMLSPNPKANRATLIRRLSLDLCGLPPTPKQLREFTASPSEGWYEQLVDELLDSPHYGEHMSRYWLDAARFGDTHGLHLDNYREMWLYRDWIIKAFHQNKSFADFTIEQLAGDLLPDPTREQRIATGFQRSHVTTNEGGSIEEEVYVRNVVDRVSTMGTVFLGLTVGCAQCHDHKFDPISQKEFYQLFAFFNNLDGSPMDGNRKDHAPVLTLPSEEQQRQVVLREERLSTLEAKLERLIAEFEYIDPGTDSAPTIAPEPVAFTWLDDAVPLGAKPDPNWQFVTTDEGPVHSGKNSRIQTGDNATVQHVFTDATLPLQVATEDSLFAYVFLDPDIPPTEIMLQFNDGDWEHRAYWGEDKIQWGQNQTPSRHRIGPLPETGTWVRLEVPAATVGFVDVSSIHGMAFTQWGGTAHWDDAGVVSRIEQNVGPSSLRAWAREQQQTTNKDLPDDVQIIVGQTQEQWNPDQSNRVRAYFLTHLFAGTRHFAEPLHREITGLRDEITELRAAWPSTLIWKERATVKPAYILRRGEYHQQGEQVSREVPAVLPPLPLDASRDRLGLAEWLISGKHPLTARVTVNRFWQQVFGVGLVETSEDFGAQGALPTHPELLDWLATDFAESGWDIKRLMKMIVMSATYRQSSTFADEEWRQDPDNRLYSRGPRFRLDAEALRDQALAVSGLLVPTIGGPSVKPPQPDGLWFVVGYSGSNTVRFKKDTGHDGVHRRSMYTFWKRTAPAPQMATFDAPSRESCSVRRERTNTPLQALLLMNDPQYVEAARFLAQSVIDTFGNRDALEYATNGRPRDEIGIVELYHRTVCRRPAPQELAIVLESLAAHRAEFAANVESAKRLVAIGEEPATERYDPVELAAWTMIASLVMNTDEFVTKN